MSFSNILLKFDKKVNIDCYDKVDYTKYEDCDSVDSVCTTQMKLVKIKHTISSIYTEARFEKV